MAYGKKRGDRLALDLNDAEAALIDFLRKHRAGYHRLIISWLGPHWFVEANDRPIDEPLGVGHGDTFAEAWGEVAGELERPERAAERQRRSA
jgi:hypothetical protein